MSVAFQGTTLKFSLRNLQAQLDCEWAEGVIGLAFFRWQPGRIWIDYYAPGLDGHCDMRSASSDKLEVDATEFLVAPGDNIEDLRNAGAKGVPEVPFSLAVILVCRRKLDRPAIMRVLNLYGEAIQKLVSIDGQDGNVFAGKIFIRCATLSSELFDAWSSATGKPPGWNGEATSLLIAPDLSKGEVEELQDLQEFALTSMMIDFCTPGATAPHPRGLKNRNPMEVLWFHVAEGHVLHDAAHWQLRDDIQAAVWDEGQRLVLQCGHLEALYASVGKEWLEEQANEVRAQLASKTINSRMNQPIHPLVAGWLWLRGDVIIDKAAHHELKLQSWALLTALSGDLVALDENVELELLHRLKGKDYRQAAFEATVAALLVEAGASVDFIAKGESRSPDLRISQNGVEFFVECSQKQPNSTAVETAMGLANELATWVLADAAKRKRSVKVEIQLSQLLCGKTKASVFKTVKNRLTGAGVDNSHVRVRTSPLGAWWDVYDANELTHIFGEDCDQIYVGGVRWGSWSMTKMTQASVVGVGMKCDRDLAKSVLRTLKAKGSWVSNKGQMPDDAHGIIAVGLGQCKLAIVKRVAQAISKRLERHHKAVSVVLLVWDERLHEDSLTTEVKTYCFPIKNKQAMHPLPDSVRLPVGQVRKFGVTTDLGPPIRKNT